MNTTKFKMFGMILKTNYVRKEAETELMKAIAEYERSVYKKKVNCDVFDTKVITSTNPYPKEGEDKIFYNMLFPQLKSGEYPRVYIIYNSKIESDYYRENAYPKNDRYAHKNIPERFADEYHVRDNRIQTPEKFGDVDGYLHWFCANAGTEVDVVHIDLNEANPKAYSVSDEFYALVDHIDYDQEVKDWAIAFGLPRDATKALLEILPDEHDRYVYANGGAEPGSTPDAQVVKCPHCGRPTWAAPASVGFKNVIGEYVPNTEDSKQMTCEHCKGSLAECFSGDDKFDVEQKFLSKEKFYKTEGEVE